MSIKTYAMRCLVADVLMLRVNLITELLRSTSNVLRIYADVNFVIMCLLIRMRRILRSLIFK